LSIGAGTSFQHTRHGGLDKQSQGQLLIKPEQLEFPYI
jgi:hypothetical protein